MAENETTRGTDEQMEEALEIVGSGTWWMWRIFLATSIAGMFNMWWLLSYVYIAPEVDFRCRVSAMDAANFTEQQQRNITDTFGNKVCDIPDLDYEGLSKLTFEEAQKKAEEDRKTAGTVKCKEYVFAKEGISLVEELSLVCDRHYLREALQTAISTGKLIGSFSAGWISDDYGRRTGFIISSSIYIGSCWLPFIFSNVWIFLISRLLVGLAASACFYSGITLSVEIASKKWRGILGVFFNFSYAVGMMTEAIISYYVVQWRSFLLTISIPIFILVISMLIIPESPRWLATQGRNDKAWRILKKAKGNIEELVGEPQYNDLSAAPPKISRWERIKKSMALIKNFFVHLELLWRLLVCMITWFIVNLLYYALPLNADNFHVNKYVTNFLMGIMEGAAYTAPIFLLRTFPRRNLSFGLFVICGLSMLSTVPVPEGKSYTEWLIIAASMITRFNNSAVFAVIIVITAELFPTEERATGLGTCAASSHVAGMISPFFVTYTGEISPKLPAGICGILTLFIACLVLLLPETKDRPLVDTIEEMEENMKRDKVSLYNLCKWKMPYREVENNEQTVKN